MADADTDLLRHLADAVPMPQVQAQLVFTAAVDVAPRESLGAGPWGERFIVPITGGRFWGAPGHEAFSGQVRTGGADRQRLRPDGIKELTAEYELQADDGAVVTVRNRVVVDDAVQPLRYAASHVQLAAPDGPHAWLNRRLFVGTLQSLRPARQAVLVRVFRLTPG